MKILFVSAEVLPFIKTGGLADVAGALPKAIKKEGHDIRVMMPKYSQIKDLQLEGLKKELDFKSEIDTRENYVGIEKIEKDEITTYFVDNKYYFNRTSLYENDDNNIQFAYFCSAVLESLEKLDFKPDVIHANDWQTALIAIILKNRFAQKEFYKDIKVVYTIHNLRYQGAFSKEVSDEVLKYIGLKKWDEKLLGNYMNFMKLALENSDMITTVSETYANEIKTKYFGEGLDEILVKNDENLYGIINGIDYTEFDPMTDKKIVKNYNADSLGDKKENKKMLQKEMGLEVREDIPLISLITRLVPQKGLDLIEAIIYELLESNTMQLVVLGTGMKKYEEMFKKIGEKFPDSTGIKIMYDGDLAQRIYAGSDMFLMPSQFEPCGLGQLISLRYGNIPIVRETGGLNDTVLSYDEETGEGNGFTFKNYNAHDMLYTIKRAVKYYTERKEIWKKLQKKAMNGDYSWKNAALEYIELYKKAKK